jgi:hypothetical protein
MGLIFDEETSGKKHQKSWETKRKTTKYAKKTVTLT